MLVLGLAAVIQLIWLPGFLILRLLRVRCRLTEGLLAGMGLSLLANHLMVFGLTMVGAYNRPVVLCVFAVECVAALAILRGRLLEPIGVLLRRHLADPLRDGWAAARELARDHPIVTFLALPAAIYLVGFSMHLIPRYVGNVFEEYDALVSWNPWAVSWSDGVVPRSKNYPQLIPTNWSLTYLFIGTSEVQVFGRAIMTLFFPAMLVMAIDLARVRRSLTLLVGTAALFVVMRLFYDAWFLTSGFVDIALAFFCLLPFYWLLSGDGPPDRTRILIGAAFAAAAMLTKHSAVIVAAAYPPMAYLVGMRPFGRADRRTLFRLLLVVAVLGALVGPWYGFKQYQMAAGSAVSEISEIQNINKGGLTVAGRAEHVANLFAHHLHVGWGGVIAFFVVIAIGAVRAPIRWGLLLIGAPLGAVWFFFINYDLRNLSGAAPYMALSLGAGLLVIIDRVSPWLAGLGEWSRERLVGVAARGSTRTVARVLFGLLLVSTVFVSVIAVIGGGKYYILGIKVSLGRPDKYLLRLVVVFVVLRLLLEPILLARDEADRSGLTYLFGAAPRRCWRIVTGSAAARAIGRVPAGACAVIAIGLVVGAALGPVDRAAIEADNYAQRIRLGNSKLNRVLLDLNAAGRLEGKVVTSYPLMACLPDVGHRSIWFRSYQPEAFRAAIAHPDARHVLIRDWMYARDEPEYGKHLWVHESIRTYLWTGIEDGRFRVIPLGHEYHLIVLGDSRPGG